MSDSPRGSSAVQIVEAISQQQLHREHRSRVSRESVEEAGSAGGRAHGRGSSEAERTADPDEPEVGKEVYFVGCIDILCEYGLKKQLEHHYKAAKHGEKVGAQNFSVVDPLQYSKRFQNFVADAVD